MKGQLSFEYMIYIVAGLASMSMALAGGSLAINAISQRIDAAYMGSLASEINSNMAYSKSTFTAYIPKCICNASLNSTSIAIGNTVYGLSGEVEFGNLCKYSGSIRTIELRRLYNGTYSLGVSK
ncbi:MAG: hypothetical protein ACP5K5_00965 [Candidatus Micrarchaeia archaeon]